MQKHPYQIIYCTLSFNKISILHLFFKIIFVLFIIGFPLFSHQTTHNLTKITLIANLYGHNHSLSYLNQNPPSKSQRIDQVKTPLSKTFTKINKSTKLVCKITHQNQQTTEQTTNQNQSLPPLDLISQHRRGK